MKNHLRLAGVLGLLLGALVPVGLAAEPLQVVVSIPPLKQIVERVGGEHVQVQVLLRPGSDPHSYEPTAKQVGDLARADLFLEIGLPFEKQVAEKVRAMKPDGLRVVDAAAGIELEEFDASAADTHEEHHGHDHDHDHGPEAKDPHIWLDTELAAKIGTNVAEALLAHPAWGDRDAGVIRENLTKFQEDLEEVRQHNAKLLETHKGEVLLVYHPAFGYFARQYGLQQWAVEAGGKSPSARQINRIVELAREKNARVIFVQPQFSPASGEIIARQIGGEVQSMDPLAEDLLGNMKIMAQTVAEAYQKDGNAE